MSLYMQQSGKSTNDSPLSTRTLSQILRYRTPKNAKNVEKVKNVKNANTMTRTIL